MKRTSGGIVEDTLIGKVIAIFSHSTLMNFDISNKPIEWRIEQHEEGGEPIKFILKMGLESDAGYYLDIVI
jgi:hypothetical protein